jgi:hypothetical protein
MWDSNPLSSSSGVAGRRLQGAWTCEFSLPVVTARARQEPGVPDLMWTQRGPAAVPVRPVADAQALRYSATIPTSSGQYPPAGPARQPCHSRPAHTACRCGRATRWPQPKRGRRQHRHRRLQLSPTRRPSPPCRMAVLPAVAARNARRAVPGVVIAQDHRGEHVYGLPVLVGGDRDSLRCGQPRLRQPWPPTTSLYWFAVHMSTVPRSGADVTVSILPYSIDWPAATATIAWTTQRSLPILFTQRR